jgi:hypothetical protein
LLRRQLGRGAGSTLNSTANSAANAPKFRCRPTAVTATKGLISRDFWRLLSEFPLRKARISLPAGKSPGLGG